MSDFGIFDISASGMSLERLRLNISALNLANVNTTRSATGEIYKPMTVLSSPNYGEDFAQILEGEAFDKTLPFGVKVDSVEEINAVPRIVYEPSHPDADDQGFVRFPNINPVNEMVNLINITRSYEANVRAFNAAKRMMQAAIDIGRG